MIKIVPYDITNTPDRTGAPRRNEVSAIDFSTNKKSPADAGLSISYYF
jgi:hypothetical protein